LLAASGFGGSVYEEPVAQHAPNVAQEAHAKTPSKAVSPPVERLGPEEDAAIERRSND
jgi:hypothetical protein